MFERLGSDPRVVLRWLAVLLVLAALQGCAAIRLVGDYDEKIDEGVTALQKDTEAFLVKMESAPGDDVPAYAENIAFYDEAKVAISALRLRADATERNSITVQQLDALRRYLAGMEVAHRSGMKEREIALHRSSFQTVFTAILTFELAKRRGKDLSDEEIKQQPTAIN
jgi:hypothetical protein